MHIKSRENRGKMANFFPLTGKINTFVHSSSYNYLYGLTYDDELYQSSVERIDR